MEQKGTAFSLQANDAKGKTWYFIKCGQQEWGVAWLASQVPMLDII